MSDSAESVPESVKVKRRLDMATNIYAATHPQVSGEGIHAILMSLRDNLTRELRDFPNATPQQFVAYVNDIEADPDDLPAAWDAEYIDLVTDIIGKLVQEENMQPAVVVDALDELVDEITEEIKEAHGIEEGFFDEH